MWKKAELELPDPTRGEKLEGEKQAHTVLGTTKSFPRVFGGDAAARENL